MLTFALSYDRVKKVKLDDQLKRELVADFLKRFKKIANQKGLAIYKRDNYLKTITYLGITPKQAKQAVMELEVSDYYKGTPFSEGSHKDEICEFSTNEFGKEVYIKLKIPKNLQRAICLSFHIPKWDIDHPFKSVNKEGG